MSIKLNSLSNYNKKKKKSEENTAKTSTSTGTNASTGTQTSNKINTRSHITTNGLSNYNKQKKQAAKTLNDNSTMGIATGTGATTAIHNQKAAEAARQNAITRAQLSNSKLNTASSTKTQLAQKNYQDTKKQSLTGGVSGALSKTLNSGLKNKTSNSSSSNSYSGLNAGASKTLSDTVSNGIKTEDKTSRFTDNNAKVADKKSLLDTMQETQQTQQTGQISEKEANYKKAKEALDKVHPNTAKKIDEISSKFSSKVYNALDSLPTGKLTSNPSADKIKDILTSQGFTEEEAAYYATNWNTLNDIVDTYEADEEESRTYNKLNSSVRSDLEKYVEDTQATNAIAKNSGAISTLGINSSSRELFDEQLEIQNRLMEENGWSKEDFNKYVDMAEKVYNQRVTEEEAEETSNAIKNGDTATKAMYSALDLAGTIPTGIDAVSETIGQAISGKHDPYAQGYRGTNLSNAIEEATSDSIDSELGKFAYSTGMSTGKSLETMALGGVIAGGLGLTGSAASAVASTITLPSFGATSFQQTYKENREAGLGEKDSLSYAYLSGLNEMLFEEISLDHAYSIYKEGGKKLLKSGLKSALTDALAQSGIEGSEEVFTELANMAADNLINHDFSQYNRMKEQYGEEYARNYYLKDIALSGAGGAVSGAVIGAGSLVTSVSSQLSEAKAVKNNETEYQSAINNALKMDKDSKAYFLAKLAESGKELTTLQVADMLASASDSKTVTESVKEELVNNGLSSKEANKSVEKVVNAIESGDTSSLNDVEADIVSNITSDSSYQEQKAAAAVSATGTRARAIEVATKEAEKNYRDYQKQTANEEQAKQKENLKTAKEYENNNGSVTATTDSGKTVEVLNFTKDSTDTVNAKVDGKPVQLKVEDINFKNENGTYTNNVAQLYNRASVFNDSAAANIALEEYKGQDTESYITLGQKALNAGLTVGDMTASEYVNLSGVAPYVRLNDSNLNYVVRMFNHGKDLRKEQMKSERETGKYNAESAKQAKAVRGTVDDSKVSNKEAESYKNVKAVADKLSKKLGVNIVLTDNTIDGASGSFSAALARITVNTTAPNALRTLLHETGEFAKGYNPEGMKQTINAVLKYMATMDAKSLDKLTNDLSSYRDAYRASVEKNKTLAESGDEYVFDFMAGILTTEEGMTDFLNYLDGNYSAKERRTIAQTIKDLWDKVIEFLSGLKDNNLGASRGKEVAAKSAKQAQEFRDMWLKAVEGAAIELEAQATNNEEVYNAVKEKVDSLETKHSIEVKDPIEKTDALIAVHNLTRDKLYKTLQYEGIPMPSIAITKASLGWTNFGDYSYVFTMDTINPKNKKNKIYAADAWTPTFPVIAIKLDEKKVYKLNDLTYDINGKIPDDMYNRANNFISSLEEKIKWAGVDGLIDEAKDNYGMKALYLAGVKGQNIETVSTEIKEEPTPQSVEFSKWIIENYDLDQQLDYDEFIDTVGKGIINHMNEVRAKENPDFKKIDVSNIRNSRIQLNAVRNRFNAAVEYAKNKGIKYRTVEDYDAEKAFVNEQVDMKEYTAWLKSTFDGIVEKTGIYNGKDLYTASGNRRSFEQLHLDVTAANIVKSMLTQTDDGRTTGGFHGSKSVRAVAVDEIKSIKQLVAASDKITTIDTDEYNAFVDDIDKRLSSVINAIQQASEKKGHSTGNSFIDMDSIGETILETAYENNPDEIYKKLNGYTWTTTKDQAKELSNIIQDIKDMPVNMFEAKPQRVVDFNEGVLVIPSDADTDIRELLTRKGVQFVEYEAGNDESRKNVVNSLGDDYKLDLSENKNKKNKVEIDKISKVTSYNDIVHIEDLLPFDIPKEFIGAVINIKDNIDYVELEEVRSEIFSKANERRQKHKSMKFYDVAYIGNHAYIYENYSLTNFKIFEIISLNNNDELINEVEGVDLSDSRKNDIDEISSCIGDDGKIRKDSSMYSQSGRRHTANAPVLERQQTNGERRDSEGNGSDKELLNYSVEVKVDELLKNEIDTDLMDLLEDNYQETIDILEKGAKALKDNIYIDEDEVKAMAKKIVNENKSKYPVAELADNLMKVFAYMKETQDASYDVLLDVVKQVATPIVNDIRERDLAASEEWKKFRDYLQGQKIALSDMQKKEVAYAFGSYNDFKRKLFGVAKFSNEGTSLDSLWSEIVDASGNQLDIATADTEQPIALARFIENYRPSNQTDMFSGMDKDKEAYNLAMDIFAKFFEMQAKNTNINASKVTSDALVKQALEYRQKYRETYEAELKKQKEILKKKHMDDLRKLLNDKQTIAAEFEKIKVTEGDNLDPLLTLEVENDLKGYDEKIEALKAQDLNKLAKQKAREAASKHKYDYAQARTRTALKNSLKSNVNYLNGLLKRPKNKQFIPTEMVQGVIDVVSSINMDTGKSKATAEKLAKLENLYERYNNDSFAFDYDERTVNNIKALRTIFEGRNYSEFTNAELEMVLDMVKSIRTQISNANKLLNMKTREYARDTAREVNTEIKGSRKYKNAATQKLNKFLDLNLNAQRWFRKTSGYNEDGAWMEVYKMLDDGLHTQMQIEREVNNIFKNVLEGSENQKQLKKLSSTKKEDLVDIGLKDESGKPVMVTRDMRLAVIMHLKNESNLRHMMDGGFKVPDLKKYASGKTADAYGEGENYRYIPYSVKQAAYENKNMGIFDAAVDEETKKLKDLENDLSDWEKNFLKDTEEFLWKYSGKVINETSTKLKGYSIARVKNYMPIHVDSNFVNADVSGLVMDRTIEGQGFLKERVSSGKPIYLEGLTNVILKQVQSVSSYAGMAVPIRNLNMLLNVQMGEDTLRRTIEKTWSKSDLDYLTNLMKDLQGGRNQTDSFNFLKNKFAGSIFALNASVAIKQAASFPTAAATLGYRSLAKTLLTMDPGKANTNGKFALRKGIKELEDINPLLWYRSQGYSTQELGDLKDKSGLSNIMPYWLDWISMFDIGTVRSLEYASKDYVDRNYKNLEKGSKEYWQQVSDVFTKAVEETQPNYTSLQRADVAKRGGLWPYLVMFKTQSFQNFGIMADATGNLVAKSRQYKLYRTADNKAALKSARNQFTHAVTSQIVAAAVYNIMGIVASIIIKRKKEEDQNGDDKVNYLDYLHDIFFGSLETLAGSVAFGSELYDAITAIFTGETYYGVDVQAVSSITDLVEDIQNVFEMVEKRNESITSADKETYQNKLLYALEDLANGLGYVFGIPVSNLNTMLQSAFLYGEDAITDNKLLESKLKTADDITSQKDRTYEALISGSSDYKQYYNEMVDNWLADEDHADKTKDEAKESINSSFVSLLKADYLDGKVSLDKAEKLLKKLGYDDEKIDDYSTKWQMAKAGNELGEDYSLTEYIKAMRSTTIDKEKQDSKILSMTGEMYKAGTASYDEAYKALTKTLGYDDETALKKMDTWSVAEINADESLTLDEYIKEIDSSKASEDKQDKQILNKIKSEFDSGNLSEEKAMEYLEKKAGYDENDAYFKVASWKYGTETGELKEVISDGISTGSVDGTEIKRLISEYYKHGKSEEALHRIPSSIASEYKEDYLAGKNKANTYAALLALYRICYQCSNDEAKKKLNSLLHGWYENQ